MGRRDKHDKHRKPKPVPIPIPIPVPVPPAGPTITSISPLAAEVTTSVTITGTGFTSATVVKFGAVQASRGVVSSTSIKATVPQVDGQTVVTVTTAYGTSNGVVMTISPFPSFDKLEYLSVAGYGAHADGSTDDTDHFQAAIDAAALADKGVLIPAGSYYLASSPTFPVGTILQGIVGGTSIIKGPITLTDNVAVNDLRFSVADAPNGANYAITGEYDNCVIDHCTFDSFTWTALALACGNDNVISYNDFNGTTGVGANVTIGGGKRNAVTYNTIDGGITSIILMASRSWGPGGLACVFEDNVISYNTIAGCSEEAINFDCHGNEPVDTAAMEYDTIVAVNGSVVTLSSHTWPDYVGYDVVFLDNALQGRTRTITSIDGNDFTLDSAPTGAAADDTIVIGSPFKNNIVEYNTISGGSPSILLYGMCFENIVRYNTTVGGDIKVSSIDSLCKAASQVTGQWGRAPSGYNRVTDNPDVDGKIYLEYYNVTDIADPLYGTPFVAKGNNVIDNVCDTVEAYYQWFYMNGNTGPGTYVDLGGNTVSGTEMT